MAVPLRTRAFWRAYRLLDRTPVMQQTADRVRAASNRRARLLAFPPSRLIAGRPDRSVAVSTTSCDAGGVELRLRVYRPRSADARPPVVMNFHGGGWVSGNPQQSEWWCAGVAAQSGAVVVSVQYRLAPENPFPTPVEDCYAATAWVAGHADEFDVDASLLAVMGDSAGGNMAAVVSLLARDRGGPPIALQVLVYPSVDLVADYPSKAENADAPVLTAKDIDNAANLYVGSSDRAQPMASPLFAGHHGLPPALIQTAQYDPLRDQGAAYAGALRAAGVPVRLTNYVDAVHGYISLPNVTVGGRQALGEVAAELRTAFGAGRQGRNSPEQRGAVGS